MDRSGLHRLFTQLDEELRAGEVHGEVFLVGGAVMCLAYQARPTTQDVDGWFLPAREVREAAARVASKAQAGEAWLNDGVREFLGDKGDSSNYLDLDHLRVMVARPEYLLAMKCLAMRIGAELHDEDDVRYLLRHLGVRSFGAATAIIGRYYPLERFPQKTLYALMEILT